LQDLPEWASAKLRAKHGGWPVHIESVDKGRAVTPPGLSEHLSIRLHADGTLPALQALSQALSSVC
jgi:hypothetical protein